MDFTRLLFPTIITALPTAKIGQAISERLNAINCAVTVVPIFAPSMTPMACIKDIKPEFTKPTTITVVAALL